eukprot:645412-Amphidinium_carterae.1
MCWFPLYDRGQEVEELRQFILLRLDRPVHEVEVDSNPLELFAKLKLAPAKRHVEHHEECQNDHLISLGGSIWMKRQEVVHVNKDPGPRSKVGQGVADICHGWGFSLFWGVFSDAVVDCRDSCIENCPGLRAFHTRCECAGYDFIYVATYEVGDLLLCGKRSSH